MTRRTPALITGLARLTGGFACLLVLAAGLSGCIQPDRTVIAVLFAHAAGDPAERVDAKFFSERVKATCDGCDIETWHAGDDSARQLGQLDAAVKAGADVVVLAPVDQQVADKAARLLGDVPLISYERTVPHSDWYVGVDPAAVGSLLGSSVVDEVGTLPRAKPQAGSANGKTAGAASPTVLLVSGPPEDAVGSTIKSAAQDTLRAGGVAAVTSVEAAAFDADSARQAVASALLRAGGIPTAIVTTDDRLTSGALEALRAAAPNTVNSGNGGRVQTPAFVGGPGESIDSARRIIRGEQSMSVYQPLRAMARLAADLAVDEVIETATPDAEASAPVRGSGAQPGAQTGTGEVTPDQPTEFSGVSAYLFTPQPITVDTVTSTTVRDGLYTIDELCSGDTLAACRTLGLI